VHAELHKRRRLPGRRSLRLTAVPPALHGGFRLPAQWLHLRQVARTQRDGAILQVVEPRRRLGAPLAVVARS
jgi:hypothetical protein